MVVWEIALEVVEEVRGSIAMFMFIIEEAIQTVGMACYINYKLGDVEAAKEAARWALDNLVNPALDFVDRYGAAAYPLNLAYKSFYLSAKRTMETYLKL